MLQCSMNHENLRLGLEDVLADLWSAKRKEDLARLSKLIHWDLRRWARAAGEELLAQRSQALLLNCPHAGREEFVAEIDRLIRDAEQAHAKLKNESFQATCLGVDTALSDTGLQAAF
jgi:hypothetical protein